MGKRNHGIRASFIPGQFHQHHQIKEEITLRGNQTVFSRDAGVIPNGVDSTNQI